MNSNSNQQLALFSIGGLIDPAINRVFAPKALNGKNGQPVGTEIRQLSRKDMAIAFELKGKANKEELDRKILEVSDEAFRVVKGEIARLDGNWTLKKTANRTLSNGERQITVVLREVRRHVGPKPEDMAKALGLTVEEILELIKQQEAALASNDVESVATQA